MNHLAPWKVNQGIRSRAKNMQHPYFEITDLDRRNDSKGKESEKVKVNVN